MTLRLADIHQYPMRDGVAARIASYLAARGIGVIATYDDMIDLCWGRHLGGGPEDARNSIRSHICEIRKWLKPGFEIRSVWGVGFELVYVQAQEQAA